MNNSRRWYGQLWTQVLFAMAIGVLLGWRYPSAGVAMQPFGDAFIKAIRFIVAPLIFCSVVHGIAGMQQRLRVGRLALKTIVYFEALTTVALVLALLAANLLRPGDGMHFHAPPVTTAANVNAAAVSTNASTSNGIAAFLLNIIPSTLVGAFADGNILQVLFVSLLCGFALSALGDSGKPLLQWIEAASRMIFTIVGYVMWLAPIGAFGAIAFTVGKFGITSLASLGRLIADFYGICLLFILVALGTVALWCRFNLFKLIRYLWEEVLVCIATTSSEVVLPRLIRKMTRAGCDEGIVGLVVPAGYSFNLDGTCLYLATVVVFLAQATDTPFGIGQQIALLAVLLVTSKGAAGVTGAAFVVLSATLSTQHAIAASSVSLVLGIHRLLSQGLTPTNYIGNAVATIALARWEGGLDQERLRATLNAPGASQQA